MVEDGETGQKLTKSQLRILHNRPNRKVYSCDDCGKVFMKKESLNNHMKLHTGNLMYNVERIIMRSPGKADVPVFLT